MLTLQSWYVFIQWHSDNNKYCVMMSADAHSMGRLHGAAGRTTIQHNLTKTKKKKNPCRMERKSRKLDTWDATVNMSYSDFAVSCRSAHDGSIFPKTEPRRATKREAQTQTHTQTQNVKNDIPWREVRRFLCLLMSILVVHSTRSAVETRPDSLWHIET